MDREELRRLIQGPLATLPTAFDDRYRLDLGTMAALTPWWVEQGLVAGTTVIKVAAAMGEGPDLADDEWPELLRTVVAAADGKAAVVCGLKPKSTLHTIEDAKRAQDLGAVGVQIDLPIFHSPTQDDLVRFYTDISDAVDLGIMIYNTFWFGPPSITAASMARLRAAERVVAVKWIVPPGQDYDEMREFADHFNVIDNSNQPVRCHRNGGRGYIDPTTAVHPAHPLAVWELCQQGRYDEAQALFDRVKDPLRAFMGKVAQRSGGYNVIKGQMAVMGKPVGPPRPPTLPLTDDELAELRGLMAGFGWPVASEAVGR